MQVYLATVLIGPAAVWVARGLRLALGGRNRGEDLLNLIGIALAGTLFGAFVAFFVMPFTGRAVLMSAALVIAMSCMTTSAAVGYGISRTGRSDGARGTEASGPGRPGSARLGRHMEGS